ncbi:hypothetical protein [Acrocarpospora sp. B8E8]|uniref:hypothetical protein n=1 Tax=Acrocarpospora sp. B8E8 TaxID=3153572 RepID=UPI00325EF405
MTAELLFEGADAYTSLAEVATATTEIESPQVTPLISFTPVSFVSVTIIAGC